MRRIAIMGLCYVAVFAMSMVAATSASAGSSGTVMAWGPNYDGQLGDGTFTPRDVPVGVCAVGATAPCPTGPYLSGVTAVSAGENHSIALLGNGEVRAWGENRAGDLGDRTTTTSDVPVGVCAVGATAPCPTGPYLSGVTAVSAGIEFSLALLSNGTVVAWGENGAGQLGNGTTTNSDVPVEVKGPNGVGVLSGVTAVSAGWLSSLALLSNGTVMAWGSNSFGQLGAGTADSNVPVAVSGLPSGVTAISAGYEHSLALLSNGEVRAWGVNSFGQLGDGTFTGPETCNYEPCSKTPVTASLPSGATAVSAGAHHSMALLSNGTVMAWGENDQVWQLGNGTFTNSDVPVGVCEPYATAPCPTGPYLSGVTAVSAGADHSIALLGNGKVRAWGDGGERELGNDAFTKSDVPVGVCEPYATAPCPTGSYLSGVTAVSTGSEHSLAISGPYWYSNGELIEEGKRETDTTSGQLTIHLKSAVTCTITDTEEVENAVGFGGGTGALTGIAFSGCTRQPNLPCPGTEVHAIPGSLPWPLHLIAGSHVAIENIEVEVTCTTNNAVHEKLMGTLTPTLGNSVYLFGSAFGSGTLTKAPSTHRYLISGFDNIVGPPGDETITMTNEGTPTAVTEPATGVTQSAATLNATVNPNGRMVSACLFEYGLTASPYEKSVPCQALPGSGNVPVAVAAAVASLKATTTYHFRIVATNSAGTSVGIDRTFKTGGVVKGTPVEWGRCVAKVAGHFTDAACATKATKGGGLYEWVKGATKAAFTASGGESTVESAAGTKVTCKTQSATGKLDVDGTPPSAKGVESMVVVLRECEIPALAISCNTVERASGEIVMAPLAGNLGVISGEGTNARVVGQQLEPEVKKGAFATFECGGGAAKFVVKAATSNCVIAALAGVNVMSTTLTEAYSGTAGVQEPHQFQSTPTKQCNLELSVNGGVFEKVAQTLMSALTFEEPLEVKA